jgi:hypothetical protein
MFLGWQSSLLAPAKPIEALIARFVLPGKAEIGPDYQLVIGCPGSLETSRLGS